MLRLDSYLLIHRELSRLNDWDVEGQGACGSNSSRPRPPKQTKYLAALHERRLSSWGSKCSPPAPLSLSSGPSRQSRPILLRDGLRPESRTRARRHISHLFSGLSLFVRCGQQRHLYIRHSSRGHVSGEQQPRQWRSPPTEHHDRPFDQLVAAISRVSCSHSPSRLPFSIPQA